MIVPKWIPLNVFAILFLLPLGLSAQEKFPLGLLGAEGQVTAGKSNITVIGVQDESPGQKAGLKVGDRIVGIAGQAFPAHSNRVDDGGTGPQRELGNRLDAVAGDSNASQRILTLNIERGAEDSPVKLELECSLPHRVSLATAAGRDELINIAAQQLRTTCLPKGYWDAPVGLTGDRVLTAWAAVALKACDDPQDEKLLGKITAWLSGPKQRAWVPDNPLQKGPDNLGNWALTATAVALVEASDGKPSPQQKKTLAVVCETLRERMTPEGRFGHDVSVGYSGNGFNVINTLSHLAWAMGHHAGVTLDETDWNLSCDQIRNSIDPNGGVRYWTMKNTGTEDASLRTSSMALALSIANRDEPWVKELSEYLDLHRARTREAHAVGSLGMLLSPGVLWRYDKAAYQRFLDEWRWYLALMQDHEGRIRYIGGKRNNGGDSYLGKNRIACVIAIMMLTPEREKLLLFQK